MMQFQELGDLPSILASSVGTVQRPGCPCSWLGGVGDLEVAQVGLLVADVVPDGVVDEVFGGAPVLAAAAQGPSVAVAESSCETALLGPEHLHVFGLADPAVETAARPGDADDVAIGAPTEIVAEDRLAHFILWL